MDLPLLIKPLQSKNQFIKGGMRSYPYCEDNGISFWSSVRDLTKRVSYVHASHFFVLCIGSQSHLNFKSFVKGEAQGCLLQMCNHQLLLLANTIGKLLPD